MDHSQFKRSPQHRHLPQGNGVKNYVPYMQTQQNMSGTQGTTGTQQNTFTPGQQALQGQLGGLYSSFLSGQIPSSFTNPAAATNAYQANFNTQVAPGLAAQYGAGSPAIGSANALGLAQLQGNLYNTGVSNYSNALSSGSNYGLGMPTGGTTSGLGAYNQSGTSTSQMNPLGFLLASLL